MSFFHLHIWYLTWSVTSTLSDTRFSRKWVILIFASWLRKFRWQKSGNFPNYVRNVWNKNRCGDDAYLGGPTQRRSPNHRYRLMDRIWCPNRCVLEYRNRSYRWLRSCRVSIRIHGPVHRKIREYFNKKNFDTWIKITTEVFSVCVCMCFFFVSFVRKSLSKQIE